MRRARATPNSSCAICCLQQVARVSGRARCGQSRSRAISAILQRRRPQSPSILLLQGTTERWPPAPTS
eukprot:10772184-Alexandrium_andersonii.AAC.1